MKNLKGGFTSDLPPDVIRLVPMIALLIIAIFLVPKLIKGDSAASVPPAGVSASLDAPSGLDPAVLVEDPVQIREFKKRLDRVNSKNPFHQPAAPEVESTEEAAAETQSELAAGLEGTEIAAADGAVTPTITEPAVTEPVAPVPTPDDGSVTPDEGTGAIDDGTDTATETPAEEPEVPEQSLYTTSVDVRVGPIGGTEVIEDVDNFDYLPDDAHPVVEFLYGGFDLTSASFVVSPAVLSNDGEGNCAPTPMDCQFIELQVGEEHSFEYSDGQRYRLKLLEVNLKETGLEADQADEAAGRVSQSVIFSAAKATETIPDE